MRFEFATATRIIFGQGTLLQLGPIAAEMGCHALVVTGRSAPRAAAALELLAACNVKSTVFTVTGEPTIQVASLGAQQSKEAGCDLVIGLGGGSVLDAGKAMAALSTNAGDPLDYLEVIGQGNPLAHPSLPYIAIPTTAGAGAEVTRNAVLISPAHRVKASLRSPLMLPRLALIDPELSFTMPPELTASTGMDALAQLIEPYVSQRANPLTDAFCRQGIACVARSLQRAFEHGSDATARQEMALASLLGGLALANAGLGAVHGFAGPIGGMFTAPHGAVCACLLPHVVAVNVQALRQRSPASAALQRYAAIAHLLTGHPHAVIDDGSVWLQELSRTLHIAPLRSYGVELKDLPTLIEKAAAASSMRPNPIKLTFDEMHQILEQAL